MKQLVAALLSAALSAAIFAACVDAPDAPPAASTGDLHSALVAQAVPVDAMKVDASALPTGDATDPRQAVGVNVGFGHTVELSSLSLLDLSGKARMLIADGAISGDSSGFVFSAAVESDGASALRLHLVDVQIPDGAELYVYSASGDIAGPYTGTGPDATGELWTPALRGQRVDLQLRSGPDAARALGAVQFSISEVGVLDDRFLAAAYGSEDKSFCSFNAQCVENAACANIPAAVQTARDAAALMLFASGGFQYICSGGLVADADPNTSIPYFLTANHCISRGREASSLQTFFHFSVACGVSNCPGFPSASTNGSTIIASNRTSDFTLLRLSQAAPSGAAFLPTNNSAVAFNNGQRLYRISHPAGAPQAYSEHVVDTGKGTCSSWPRGSWIYTRDSLGATEGGSSGSLVLNGAGEVVGQLSGACGTNVNDNCDANNNATVDGALAAYWSQVEPFLGGGGTGCTDADGDGYCPSDGDCNDNNAAINPGATENCTDGVDNDCDGNIDSADSDCSGGACFPSGTSCSANADCCSRKCRGRKNPTCR